MTYSFSMRGAGGYARPSIPPLERKPIGQDQTMQDIFSVVGRTAVVTGGLGQLGTQFSKSLAEADANVAIYSRRPFSDEQLAQKFPGLSDRIRIYEANVRDKAALERATEQLVADWGVPHILVNNAGIDSKPD